MAGAAIVLLVASSNARAATCGQPASGGAVPTATDARVVLTSALGSADCDACVCDVDSSGDVTATDARRVLLRSLGTGAELYCPLCDTAENRCGNAAIHDTVTCQLVVGVVNPVGKLGALAFKIRGSSAGYEDIRCGSAVPSALAAFNDLGDDTLSVGMIDLEGFTTPASVVYCTFHATGLARVTDLQLTLVDAATTAVTDPPEVPILAVTHLDGF